MRHGDPGMKHGDRGIGLRSRVMALPLLLLFPIAACGDSSGSAEAGTEGAPVGTGAAATPTSEVTDTPRPGAGQPFADGPELWMASLSVPADPATELPQLGAGRNITERAGYDNQPEFAPDGTLFYTLGVADRTDIWRYDPVSGAHAPVTRTPNQSEYSATPMPGWESGRRAISIIRVEVDSAQRLWQIDLDAQGAAAEESVIVPNIDPVGYHAWVNDTTLALFVLGSPATLQLARPGPAEGQVLASGIGRGIERMPGREAVSFTESEREGGSHFFVWDQTTGTSTDLGGGVTVLPAADHAWTPGGVMIFGQENGVFAYRPGVDEPPRQIGTLPDSTMVISRLAISPDGSRIVLVVDRPSGD